MKFSGAWTRWVALGLLGGLFRLSWWWRARPEVTWDGRVGFDEVRPWNPAPESSWTPGANFIGMCAVPRLSGAVDRIERLPVD